MIELRPALQHLHEALNGHLCKPVRVSKVSHIYCCRQQRAERKTSLCGINFYAKAFRHSYAAACLGKNARQSWWQTRARIAGVASWLSELIVISAAPSSA